MRHLGCRAEVLTVDPMTLDEVIESINTLGRATGCTATADSLVASLRARLEAVRVAVNGRTRPRIAVLEWTDPLFSAGHWVPDLVTAAGAEPVIGDSGARSREITAGDVLATQPEIVVVSPCGYRLDGAAKLGEELLATGALPSYLEVWAVDADANFVRPGPRVVDGVETLAAIAHPGVVAMPEGAATRLQ
jgi:iron complex transport system substrate-binding protein